MSRAIQKAIAASVLAGLMTVVAAGPSGAGQHVWTKLTPALASPPRAAMTMAFDPVSGFLVTFGGFDANGQYLNQTWIWDGIEWAQPIVQTPPPPRAAAGMAYDRISRQLVLFGGYDGSSHPGDTWTWDGSNNSWTHRNTTNRPPGVSGPMLFTDPINGHVDMVGGFDGMLFQSTTWQWTGSDWKRLDPATSLTGRGSAIAELDRTHGTVVVFGGIGSLRTDNTWTWDGTNWTEQAPAHQPPSRFYSASAYSPALRAVVIFGGASAFGDLNDTWAWNGSDWRQLRVGTPPAKRESPGMAYDPGTRQITLFGGQVGGGVAGDTWAL